MIRPSVEVLLTMVDRLTGPLRGTSTGVKGAFTDMKMSLNGFVAGFASLYTLRTVLGNSFRAADEFRVALQKLEGTAKITGVPLAYLRDLAAQATDKFGLSKVQAADFAVEMAKLATKAGDVGKAGPALQAFLDIGAARGLTASETLKAVQQAILGIDEGTDKLFNANPSVLYEAFAASIGTTAGKLTDQQKAQALLNAAMTDGSKVAGAYSAWLETTAGKIQLAKNRTDEAYASLGLALDGVRTATAGAISWIAGALEGFVGGIQLIANDIGYWFARIPHEFAALWGTMLVKVANGLDKLGALIPLMGDGMQRMADSIGQSGARMVHEHGQALGLLKQAHEEVEHEIVGIVAQGQVGQTAAFKSGTEDRAEIDKQAKKEAEKREKEAGEALNKLREDAVTTGLTALGRTMQALDDKLNTARLSRDEATHEEALRLWREAKAKVLAEHAQVAAGVKGQTLEIRSALLTVPPALETVAESTISTEERVDRLRMRMSDLSTGVRDGADQLLMFAENIGAATPEVRNLIGGVGDLAEGMRAISGATDFAGLLGGIGVAVAGLQGVLGSLFGDSPAEQARKALLKENSNRLRDLKGEIGDLMNMNQTGAMLAKFNSLAPGMAQFATGGDSKLDEKGRAFAFAQWLMSQGVTMTDAENLAKDLGIQLMGDDGRLSAGAVQQFMQAIQSAEFGQFDQSVSGQRDFIETLMGVTGNDDPATAMSWISNQLMGPGGAPAFFAPLLAGNQWATAEGREAIRGAFGTTLLEMNSGQFDEAMFGGLTGKEFVEFIEFITDLFDEMDAAGATAPAPAPEPDPSAYATTPSYGEAPTFEAPGVTTPFDSGAMDSAGLSTLSSSLGTLVEHAAKQTALQERIATAAERVAAMGRPQVQIGTLNAQGGDGKLASVFAAIDEALGVERDLRAAAIGGGDG